MVKATYRTVRFQTSLGERFIAIAWNYEEAVLISTCDHESISEAKAELLRECRKRNVTLEWFDGHYDYGRDGFMSLRTV